MADKEATVFIVDLCRSMGKKRSGRLKSDLDWSLQYVWDKITNVVYLGRKTLFVGVLGLGTDETNNAMGDEGGYSNIDCLQELQPMVMQDLRELPKKLKPSRTDHGDALSAIVLAVQMIMKHCRNLQYKKKIILVTNGTGEIDEEDVDAIVDEIKKNNIQLTVLGVDFDDSEYGYKEEDKSAVKDKNERILKEIADRSDGIYGTMLAAIEDLAIPFVKPVRPTPTYKGQLLLGDPEKYGTALAIDVERYFKVSVRRPPTASSYVIRSDASEDDSLKHVENSRTYTVSDLSKPGETQDVQREELAKGYEYGRTAVHISESDENITKLETEAGYHILGFVPRENIERYLILDNTNMIVAQRGNDKAALALSSIIHALHELDSCAIARLVKKDMTDPQLTLLTPYAKKDIECLIENILPYAEDLRQYRFPPLDKIVTVSGKHLTSHRNLPSDELVSAMSDFVDSMSLVEGDKDEDERVLIAETFSPVNFSIEQGIKYRAVHPGEEVPAIPETFLAYSRQPEDLQEQSQSSLDRLIKAADVKKVPPKVKGRRKYRDTEKPVSGLKLDELFRNEKRTRISPDNAIPEFKQALDVADDTDAIQTVVKQMETIIRNQARDSFGSSNYNKIVEELGVMRQQLIEFEEPAMYNSVIRRLKEGILGEQLGENRKELWWKIRVGKLGLIDRDQSEQSEIMKDEAQEFMYAK